MANDPLRNAKMKAIQGKDMFPGYPWDLNEPQAEASQPESGMNQARMDAVLKPTELGKNVLKAMPYFQQLQEQERIDAMRAPGPHPESPQAASERFRAGAMGVGMDLLDPIAAGARELTLALGGSKEDAQVVELAMGAINPLPGAEMKAPLMIGMIGGSPEAARLAKQAVRRLQDLAPESLPGKWAARVEDPSNLRDAIEAYRTLPREAIEHFETVGSPGVRGAAWRQKGVQKGWVKPGSGAELHEWAGHGSYADLGPQQQSFWEKQVKMHGRHPGVPKRITDPKGVASESYAETMEDLLTRRDRHPELTSAMAQAMGIDPLKLKP